MRLIKPYTEILEQEPGLEGMYKHIERCARTCYKSEDKIGEGTAEKMVKMLKNKGHTAMLEHGTVYLKIHWKHENNSLFNDLEAFFRHNPYSKISRIIYKTDLCPTLYITTNYRVLLENFSQEKVVKVLNYQCNCMKHHKKRITVKFVCDRGILAELTRHRVFSFAVESTRYCNYSKDKFSNEVTFIIPCWLNIPEGQSYWYDGFGYRVGADKQSQNFGYVEKSSNYNDFLDALENAEKSYFLLVKAGWAPQQARAVLPNALKTEVCMTGFVSDWENFFKLRCDKAAHPQMRELVIPLQEKMKKYGILY